MPFKPIYLQLIRLLKNEKKELDPYTKIRY
jgi:hypothetical protein